MRQFVFLKNMHFRSKKSLGQNFLVDQNILKKIVEVGEITKNDNVLEIGPGTGNLTKYIVKTNHKSLTIIEKDTGLIKDLKNKFNKRVNIINDDILNLSESFYENQFIVYGNLPYNISTQILANWCLFKKTKFKKLILMFQKEVADRILAKINTKDYSRITVLANWKFNVKKIFNISPECFSPKPKVYSSLLIFTPKNNIVKINNPLILEKITRVFFSQRRKMVKKSFSKLFKDCDLISNKIGVRLSDRAQNISIDKYFLIAKEYENRLK